LNENFYIFAAVDKTQNLIFMRNKNHPPKATFESAWALIRENAKFLQESTKSMQEDTKALKEGTKAMQESNRIANERMESFCRSMDESIKDMQKKSEKNEQILMSP